MTQPGLHWDNHEDRSRAHANSDLRLHRRQSIDREHAASRGSNRNVQIQSGKRPERAAPTSTGRIAMFPHSRKNVTAINAAISPLDSGLLQEACCRTTSEVRIEKSTDLNNSSVGTSHRSTLTSSGRSAWVIIAQAFSSDDATLDWIDRPSNDRARLAAAIDSPEQQPV